MAFHANLHARIDHCVDCKQVITQAYLAKDGLCRHCHVKNKHGGNYPENSFINKVSRSNRNFNILGKSNKDAIVLSGKVIEPSGYDELPLGFFKEVKEFVQSLGLSGGASDVETSNLEGVHQH